MLKSSTYVKLQIRVRLVKYTLLVALERTSLKTESSMRSLEPCGPVGASSASMLKAGVLGWIVAGMLACPAQDTAVFRTDIALVRVDAEVTDGTQLLAGLQKEDFLIKDNGQPQPILYF